MKDIKLKLIAISCILLILAMPVYTARVFAQDEQNEDNEIIVDNTPPSINIEKPPEKVSEPFLDIKGTTNEPIIIEVTLNSNYYGTASSNEDNSISIGITLAEGENKITINSTDAGGNSVINEFNVFCDSEEPQILYNNIYELSPAYTAKQTVKGQVNKPDINIDVFVNDKNKYSGKSDSEGNFEIDIKLEKSIKIGVTDKSITIGTQEGNAWENKIKIVATDDYGREATVEDIITYTQCGYGSDWDVKTGKITPDVVIPEHLIQGISQFSFPINLTYKGRGDPSGVALTSEPQLTSYELSSSSMEKYQDELFAGGATSYWNDDYTIGYFIVNLNSWPYTKEELNNLSFIKIPLRLDIYYEYEDMNGNIVENTQRNCWTISIMVDKEIPLDKIPKELLNATINLLNSTINLIDGIKKPVDTVKKYTFIGCLGSWLVHLFKSASVEFSCVGVKPEAIQALINGEDSCIAPQTDEVDSEGNLIELNCDACLQDLKSLREFEKTRNWICDRIFCPSVPSLEYHKESYKDSITDVNLCKGIPGIEESFEGKSSDECEEEYKFAWDSAFMTLDEWERASAEEGEREESFFDKISEGLAFCKKESEVNGTVITVDSGKKQEIYIIGKDGEVRKASDWAKIEGDTIPDENGVLIQEGAEKIFYNYETKYPLLIDDKGYYIYEGEANNFYEKSGNIYVCSGEICDGKNDEIIIFNNALDEKTQFYIDDNGKVKLFDKLTDNERKKLMENSDFKTFTDATNLYEDNDGNIKVYNDKTKESDIKKIPSIVQSNRGIEGKGNYILDPTSDFIRSVQAVCLPAVSGYLNLWKQILEAVKQCFETIMITGEGSAGVCKAVLTTYVCDMIYDAIACAGESFVIGADEEIRPGIFGVVQQIATAGNNVFDSVSNRYGETGMYNTMFNERKLINSVCLFAFTGDWGEFDLDTLLSAEIGMPTLGSEGLLYPTTRRFLGFNPLDYGRTTYVYHIGAGIIAGADLNYRVYLQCSNDNSCTDGRCDCFYRGKEEIYNVDSGSLSAGDLYSDEFYIDIPDSPVRYDKAVIEWDWTDNNNQLQTTTKVSEIKDMGEKAPSDCKLDSASGEFRCKYIIGEEGYARFVDINAIDSLDKRDVVYNVGDIINFDIMVELKRPDSGYRIPKYFSWKIIDGKGNEIAKIDKPSRIPITDGNWENKAPAFKIEDVFGKEAKSTMDRYELEGDYKTLQVDQELFGNPTKDLLFAIIFSGTNYKKYNVEKEGNEWKIVDGGEIILEPKEEKEVDVLSYMGAQFEITRPSDKQKYGRVISVDAGGRIQGCDKEGKAYWDIKFELLNSKLKKGYEEGKLSSYECCGKSIETEEFEITINCGEEYKPQDKEETCEPDVLIGSDESCKCGDNILEENDFGINGVGYVICCEGEKVSEIFYYESGLNDEEIKQIDESYLLDEEKVSQKGSEEYIDYINELCNKPTN